MKFLVGALMALTLVSVSFAQDPGGAGGGMGGPGGQGGPGGPGGQGGPGGGRGRGPGAPEVVAPSIPIDVALAAAKAAVAACSSFKFGLVILDQSGDPKLTYVMDGSAGTHASRAAGKAMAALAINAPSEGLNDRAKADPEIAAKVQAAREKGTPMMGMSGGFPIVINGKPMGALAVSGAEPGGHDPECAAAAMKVIQAQVK